VARLAEVSRGTVTRVLSGSGYASEEARGKVLQAAEQLGYEPNSHAQRLVQGRDRKTIALFSPTLDFGVGALIINFLQWRLQANSYSVPLHALNWTVREDASQQIALLRELRRQKPCGLICNTEAMPPAAWDELRRFQDEGGVLACYSYSSNDMACDKVIFDVEDNTYQAARHLLEQGHRAIAFCPHGLRHPHDDAREHGFRRAHEEFGVPVREEWMLDGGNYEEGGAIHASKFLALRQRPTGVCIVNDVSAATFVNELQRAGVRVPEDVSIVSHDDVPAARYASVPLTTVSQPCQTIANHVIDMLLSRVDRSYDGAARTIHVRGEIIVRDSAATPATLVAT
jgi:DNA-binding LacI/PurR family transcriptional regulator